MALPTREADAHRLDGSMQVVDGAPRPLCNIGLQLKAVHRYQGSNALQTSV